MLVVNYLHVLSAYDIGRTQQNGIAELLRGFKRFFERVDRESRRTRNAESAEQPVELFPVLCNVDTACGGPENLYAMPVEEGGQLYSRLTAERDNNAYRVFRVDNVHNILGSERLKVESVGGVVVGGNGFGIVIHYNDIVSHLFEGVDAVDGGVVEFYALSYSYGTRAEYENDGLARTGERARFAFAFEGRIEIRRLRVKFRAAGVDHFEGRFCMRQSRFAAQLFKVGIGKAELFAG